MWGKNVFVACACVEWTSAHLGLTLHRCFKMMQVHVLGSKSALWQSAVQEPQGVAPNVASPACPTSPQMAAAWLLSRCVLWTDVSSTASLFKISRPTPILKDDACWCCSIWKRCGARTRISARRARLNARKNLLSRRASIFSKIASWSWLPHMHRKTIDIWAGAFPVLCTWSKPY